MHPPLLHCELSITAGLLDPLSGLLDPAAPTKGTVLFASLRVVDYVRLAFDFDERLSGRVHRRVSTYDPFLQLSTTISRAKKRRVYEKPDVLRRELIRSTCASILRAIARARGVGLRSPR